MQAPFLLAMAMDHFPSEPSLRVTYRRSSADSRGALDIARAGVDIVKDDHGLTDQPTAQFACRGMKIDAATRNFARHGRDAMLLIGGSLLMQKDLEGAARQLVEAAARAGELRYFELAPGGYSSLERHKHPHAVVVLKGKGTVRLGESVEPVGAFDVVYVAPHEAHRFSADSSEALGFLCIVDRERDRPVVVDEGTGDAAR